MASGLRGIRIGALDRKNSISFHHVILFIQDSDSRDYSLVLLITNLGEGDKCLAIW